MIKQVSIYILSTADSRSQTLYWVDSTSATCAIPDPFLSLFCTKLNAVVSCVLLNAILTGFLLVARFRLHMKKLVPLFSLWYSICLEFLVVFESGCRLCLLSEFEGCESCPYLQPSFHSAWDRVLANLCPYRYNLCQTCISGMQIWCRNQSMQTIIIVWIFIPSILAMKDHPPCISISLSDFEQVQIVLDATKMARILFETWFATNAFEGLRYKIHQFRMWMYGFTLDEERIDFNSANFDRIWFLVCWPQVIKLLSQHVLQRKEGKYVMYERCIILAALFFVPAIASNIKKCGWNTFAMQE